jgi:pilus assembly protein CpaB
MRRGGRLFLLLGILIIVAAALAYFVITQPQVTPPDVSPQPTQEVKRRIVIARIDIPSNTVLTDTETFLSTIEIPESEFNSAAGQYFASPNDLLNKQTVRQINFNERIRKADITEPGLSILIPTALPNQPRPKAITVQVNNLSGVADQIRPGDFVDMLASFDIQRTIIRPGFGENNQIVFKEESFTGHATKALIQNVQVLQILKPAVPQGTPGAEGGAPAAQQQGSGPPQTDANGQPVQQGQAGDQTAQPTGPQTTGTFQTGDWILTLAMTDQQAEILKFSVETGTITLTLRGRGDTGVDTTVGSTLSILVAQFGLPLPSGAMPDVVSPNDLTPVPTSAVPVNPNATPTPTPSPTPGR